MKLERIDESQNLRSRHVVGRSIECLLHACNAAMDSFIREGEGTAENAETCAIKGT